MNNSKYHPLSNKVRLLLLAMLVIALIVSTDQSARAFPSPAPVNLGAAGSFVILTKTGITNVPISAITGDLGTSPIAASATTGFSLINDATNMFSTSSQVTGKIYAADYAAPTPANLTTAVSNMEAAYTDAAGRSLPDATELFAGDLSGRTFAPGLYKWSTGVLITTDVMLSGSLTDVWIFQIAGDLTMGSGAQVLLSGGAQAGNIFWQVGGGTGVEIGTTAHVEGTILAEKAIHLRTGASLNGRALAQTAVTLEKNQITIPGSTPKPACNDGFDSDADGLTDFPADPGCSSPRDLTETQPDDATQCDNGLDDDLDGLIDTIDPDCNGNPSDILEHDGFSDQGCVPVSIGIEKRDLLIGVSGISAQSEVAFKKLDRGLPKMKRNRVRRMSQKALKRMTATAAMAAEKALAQLPDVILSCPPSPTCMSVSNVGLVDAYKNSINKIEKNAGRAYKRVANVAIKDRNKAARRLSGFKKKLAIARKKLSVKAQALPTIRSECVRP